MSSAFKLWDGVYHVPVKNQPNGSIISITYLKSNIYLLTINYELYYGLASVEQELELSYFQEGKFRSIAACQDGLLLVNLEGRVFKYTETLELVEEVTLMLDIKTCSHGCSTKNLQLKVNKVCSACFGTLFVTESGQLWASGSMPQIGIKSNQPKRVTFFENRKTLEAKVGDDFAIIIVSKQVRSEDSDSDVSDTEIFVPNCTQCIANLPNGHNLDLLSLSYNEYSDSSSVASKSYSEINDRISPCSEKVEKNIIFRNTEAARDFLTRQIMWVSTAGEEYLSECTEKPGRIIKENVSTVANLVYEGVKTLSKHVNGSFDNCIEEVELPRITLSDEFVLSISQNTSERDQSDCDVQERCSVLAKVGCNLLHCEVWTWGNVTHGQLGIGDNIKRERPIIISKLSNMGVSDISVQGSHAAARTLDGRVYLWGRNDYGQVTSDSKVDQSSPKQLQLGLDDRVRDVACGSYQTVVLTSNSSLKYMGKNEGLGKFEETNALNIVTASEFILINLAEGPGYMLPFISKEQQFLEEMIFVNTNLVKVISKKYSILANFNLYEQLTDTFSELLFLLSTNVHSLLEFSNNLIDEVDVVIFKYAEEYLYVYKKYFNVTNDLISLGGFHNVSKFIDGSLQFFKTKLGKMLSNKTSVEQVVSEALLIPVKHLETYISLINSFIANCPNDNQKFNQIFVKWQHLLEEQTQKQAEAERTNKFWLSLGKQMEQLCTPSRRLIRDSREHPIQIQNAGRFSSPWLILLTDILIHINGSTTRTYHLSTVWIEANTEEIHEEIRLKMPEEELILCAADSQIKAEWLQAIQNGIKAVLNKSGKIQPPAVRSAEYTFRKIGFYKDVCYKGRWCNGKMHGTGKLQWPDGRIYSGQLSNNQIYGFGRMEIPNFGVYEGLWKDNYQNGLGILKYTNGDVYKGTFKDGLPHSHGSLSRGSFTASTASIYVGDWVVGNKSGYGVMDNIATGEKYLGLWLDNLKHGCGLMVTSDGVYYEGTFHQGTLSGHGLMILEDGTHYEGDFKGTGLLNGKGALTLNSGHKIEGTLSGSLSDGIRISNGTLNLCGFVEQCSIPASFTKLCPDPDQKWKCLFRRCYQTLGITDKTNLKEVNSKKIWQNIAVMISNSHRDSLRIKCDKSVEYSLHSLDTIPNFCRTTIDIRECKELEQYLQKAFESSHHPLGTLLYDLTVAYTTTYGGLRAHPLLLTHAVEELHSITKRLYEIIKLLFPALPDYDKETCLDSNQVVNYSNILYPLLLPKVHSALFILYTLHNKPQDVQYWKRLIEWNKYTDCTLLAFLSVDQKFLNGEKVDETFVRSPAKDETFVEAIETLQLLKTTFSPYEKLLIIQQTFEKMTEIVQIQLGQDYKWSMDDLFPAFLYVVVRARILQLGSEIHFIQDFAEPNLENGELGIMFTTLKACYQQVLQEKGCIS